MTADGSSSLRIDPFEFPQPDVDVPSDGQIKDTATLAGGCFWCTEAVFKELTGVMSVRSGYVGGTAETADYRTVCSGTTDHAEAIEIQFDPRLTSYGEILKLFFAIAHDPTQVDGQGNDRGRQYRSTIFFKNEAQRSVAEAYIDQLERAGVFAAPIATTLEPLTEFHEAEAYHQDYAARNPDQPYIVHVSSPKVEKLRAHFGDRLKQDQS